MSTNLEIQQRLQMNTVLFDKFTKKAYKRKLVIKYVLFCLITELILGVSLQVLPLTIPKVTSTVSEVTTSVALLKVEALDDTTNPNQVVLPISTTTDTFQKLQGVLVQFLIVIVSCLNALLLIFQILELVFSETIIWTPQIMQTIFKAYKKNEIFKNNNVIQIIDTHMVLLDASYGMSTKEKIVYITVMIIPIVFSLWNFPVQFISSFLI